MKYTHVPGRMQPGMNFMKVHAFILCVSWCQIERAARLRLQLGNLLHLHAIMSVKSPPVLVLYCYLNMPTINKTYLIQKHEMILTRQA